MGGASIGGVAPETPTGDPGGRIVGGQFSRGRWREIRRRKWEELQAAITAVEAKAAETNRAKERKALKLAVAAARAAVDEIEEDYQAQRLVDVLQAAVDAQTMAGVINAANAAAAYARAMQDDLDDEDDIEILLLH